MGNTAIERRQRMEYVLNTIIQEFSGWPRSELIFATPFQLLVAVILSAQTTDKQVNVVTSKYFASVKIPEDALVVSANETENLFSGVNYYKTKSRHIRAAAEMLVRNFHSKIPKNLWDIQKLPGVGIKTAKVVLSVLYNLPYVGVDTHVHRVLNRLGIVKTDTPEETDSKIERLFTREQKIGSHHPIVLFGRYRCTARKPKCETCKLMEICPYFRTLLRAK